MSKLQSAVLILMGAACAALLWAFTYAAAYDIRVFLRSRTFSGQFLSRLSDDIFAPFRHVYQNWPPLSLLGRWHESFIVTNTLIACIPIIVGVAAALILRRSLLVPDYHGDARLMKHSELHKEGLAQKSGLILGRAGNIRVIDSEQSHAIVVGPPASGKTESIVIPNLIEWEGSFIAIDFKGTLYDRTAKIRAAAGDVVYLLAPGFEESHTYNPLDLLRPPPFRISDIQALATLIVPTGEGKEVHWNRGAQTLFSGLVGFVMESRECEGKRAISTVVDMFSATKNIKKTCEMVTRDPDISEWTRARIIEFMNVPDEEAGSFQSTLTGNLLAWQNPSVAALTSSTENAVRLEDVRKKRMAVYLKIDTGQIDIFAQVLRLFLEQVNSIVNREYRQKGEHKILFMIDEFYQLGRVKSIINQLPFARDRDIRIVLVSQGIAQIDEKFGRDGRESIMASCALKVFCSFNDKPTVDLVTHMAGQSTQRIKTVSKQMPTGGGFSRKTQNEQFQARPLFRADELFAWPRNDILIMRTNKNPLVATKILADRTAQYIKRQKSSAGLRLIAPRLANVVKFIPSWGVNAGKRAEQAGKDAVTDIDGPDEVAEPVAETAASPSGEALRSNDAFRSALGAAAGNGHAAPDHGPQLASARAGQLLMAADADSDEEVEVSSFADAWKEAGAVSALIDLQRRIAASDVLEADTVNLAAELVVQAEEIGAFARRGGRSFTI